MAILGPIKEGLKKIPYLRKANAIVKESKNILIRDIKRNFGIANRFTEYKYRKSVAAKISPASCVELQEFVDRGFAKVKVSQDLMPSLIELSRKRLAEGPVDHRKTKPFFQYYLRPQDYQVDSLFLKYALSEAVLATVAKAMGTAPYLIDIDLIQSVPVDGGGALSYSQQWHIDETDKEIIKMVTYINDVSMDNGPFTLVPQSETAKVPYFSSHYMTDSEFEKFVDPKKIQYLDGPSGTSLLVNTGTCYHLGSRCKKPRLAFFAAYETAFGVNHQRIWNPSQEQLSHLTELQRLAVTLC